MEADLRPLERRARETREVDDVNAYVNALMRLGSKYLQSLLGTGRDSWQNLIYRHALKLAGGGQADLDLSLPHWWSVFCGWNLNYVSTREALEYECRNDHGIHPFFDQKARPLTFKETIQARLDQFDQSGGKNWSLWESRLDSCTGIVWEAGARRFKIVPMHAELLSVRRLDQGFVPANFARTPGIPISVNDTYNFLMIPPQIMAHSGWLAAVEGDEALLQRYIATAFGRMGSEQGLGFYVPQQGLPDHLRPLSVDNLHNGCHCNGNREMRDGRFAQVRSLLPQGRTSSS